jgi:DNA repair protein SbcC/Rad50
MDKEYTSEIIKVKIENFQSHENTVLDFRAGLNVIVGPSDQGKSAVIRAIKWVLYNEPRGMEFIRQGTTFARVTLEMSTGNTIVRERSKSKNRYVVIAHDGTESVFEGFGNEIPKEVIEAHGIPKVILDADISSNLNLGEQLEGPFLLSETGSTRAKALGRLTGTHIIDNAIRDSMTDLRRENQTSDRLDKELQDINTKLEGYMELDKIKERLELSENKIVKLQQHLDKLQNLIRITDSLKLIEDERHKAENTIGKLNKIHECENIIERCTNRYKDLKTTSRLNISLKELSEQSERINDILLKTQNYETCESLLKKIQNQTDKFVKLRQNKDLFNRVSSEIESSYTTLNRTKRTEELLQKVKNAEILFKKHDSLASLSEKYELCKKEIAKVEKYNDKYRKIDTGLRSVEILDKNIIKLEKLTEIRDQFAAINNYISEGIKFTETNKIQISKLVNDYAETLKKAGKCPTCGIEISDLKLEEILKHYKEANL